MSRRNLSVALALTLASMGALPSNREVFLTEPNETDPVKPKIGKSSKHTVKFSGVLKARRIAKTRKNIRKHASKRKY